MGVRVSLILFPAHVTNFALLGLPCPTLIWGQVINHFMLFILMTELIWSSPEPCLYLELCLRPLHAIYHDSMLYPFVRLSTFLSSMYFPQFQLYYFFCPWRGISLCSVYMDYYFLNLTCPFNFPRTYKLLCSHAPSASIILNYIHVSMCLVDI